MPGPISLTSWAQAWALAGSMHYGLGIQAPIGAYALRGQFIPKEVWGMVGQRSGIQFHSPFIRLQWGQSDFGPGHSLQLQLNSMSYRLFLHDHYAWFQWLGQGPLGLTRFNIGPQGIQTEGLQGRWSYALSSRGLKQIAWKGDLLQWRWRQSSNHWEAFAKLSRASLRLQGQSTWERSQLRFDYQGKSLEFFETHSHHGLTAQLMARIPVQRHQLFLSWSSSSSPWRMVWDYRPKFPIHGQIAWSDAPYLRRFSVQFRRPNTPWSIAWDQTYAGWSLRLQHPRFSVQGRPGMWTARLQHTATWNRKAHYEIDEARLPVAPQLHIACTGQVDHEPFPLTLLDMEGRSYIIHILRGNDQWKWHLAPGEYHWKPGQQHAHPGWDLNLSEGIFHLEPGKVSHLQIHIQQKEKDVYWL